MKVVLRLLLILLLLLLIGAILLGGLFILHRLQVVNMQDVLAPVLSKIGWAAPAVPVDDSDTLLNQARFEKRLEALAEQRMQLELSQQQLDKERQKIADKEVELTALQQKLEAEQQVLDLALQRYQEKSYKLRQLVQQLNNMPPDRAVAQLNQMDPYLVVDLLRQAELVAAEQKDSSMVSYWMSLMPPERSAAVGDLMIKKP